MTSTNMFQGLDSSAKSSSRVLRPPGGTSSNIFGGYEDDASAQRKPNKMASSVFDAPEETQKSQRRSHPPGGKSSNIFGQPPAQPQKPVGPPGGTSVIFGSTDSSPAQSPSHPNKPKDNLKVGPESPALEPVVSKPEAKAEAPVPAAEPAKEVPTVPSVPEPVTDETSLKNHEPHLGPLPRSHNRVLNPPGGKSSVVFY
ncbi:jupiter microtubule associated homolog 2 [Eucyclogobius newberryi]|uniref:jupiter microtubule associated homolog 2 n=1 Tax=Eucyclogobius newberryi TaxID=166745 RepID=UPI003B5BECF7